jgi:glycosyl transferase family 7 (putative galactosyltransferase)
MSCRQWLRRWRRRSSGKGITLLVPFRSDGERRSETWGWLREYWRDWLPAAELVEGHDGHFPFCKTAAVNDAFRRSAGDIIVILDADCYIDAGVVLGCAGQIRAARRRRRRMWFIPYRHFYRLTDAASRLVLASSPQDPYRFSTPPPPEDTEEASGQSVGHWYGALIQVMPREAFIAAGGMDERFSGWGGEDISFMNAVDTLYAPHHTTRNQTLHMWHPHIGVSHLEREWEGQLSPGANNALATRYQGAFGRPSRMLALTREPGAGVPGEG